jgi:hypothetical protein
VERGELTVATDIRPYDVKAANGADNALGHAAFNALDQLDADLVRLADQGLIDEATLVLGKQLYDEGVKIRGKITDAEVRAACAPSWRPFCSTPCSSCPR